MFFVKFKMFKSCVYILDYIKSAGWPERRPATGFINYYIIFTYNIYYCIIYIYYIIIYIIIFIYNINIIIYIIIFIYNI